MSNEKFTVEAVTEALERIVAEKGEDYVYPQRTSLDPSSGPSCSYSRRGKPSCIVGHVIAAIDPEYFATLAEAEKKFNTSASIMTLSREGILQYDDALEAYSNVTEALDLDRRIEDALGSAQTAQDGGLTWGTALRDYFSSIHGQERLQYG